MVSNFHTQPPFFVLNCLQIRIKVLSHSSFTTTSASFHSPQMSQPHMLYFSRRTFPLKYCVWRKCLHLQFTTYHIIPISRCRIDQPVSGRKRIPDTALTVFRRNLEGPKSFLGHPCPAIQWNILHFNLLVFSCLPLNIFLSSARSWMTAGWNVS